MDDFQEFINKLQQNLEQSFRQCMEAAPMFIEQEFRSNVTRKLKTSAEEYMNALKIESISEGIIEVSIEKNSWLANAVEDGLSSFDMKQGLLKSKKVKRAKDGHKYLIVPMEQSKSVVTSGTEKGQALQNKIKQILNDKSTGFSSPRLSQSGPYVQTMEKLKTDDPQLKGLTRVRQYENKAAAQAGVKPRSSQFVLFRVVSENSKPESWQHPGIEAKHIFEDVKRWAQTVLPQLLNDIIAKNLANLK